MLGRVSRTFALSNRYLPQPLRRAMTVSYLLFRVSDYLEDNHVMSPARKVELLNLWERVLSGRGGRSGCAVSCRTSRTTIRKQRWLAGSRS
ncbi:squalene/phytoene synthase family protein [Halomonas sp.]|uniref:squalene/phytoene synthase family protein n=1 Tax=Halomonas sp. TaxID=1486246 RepID=UPI003A1026F2